ncbi:5-formyltetrahydrofolate cyclo-ligase [Salinicoccus sp. CNSTN-B1]
MNKKDMRKEMMDRLASLDPSDKKRKEETLKTKLLEYISQLNITSVGIVLSMPHEMDTDGIISQLKSQGIEIYTPVCNYDQKVMNFCEFSSFDAVVKDEKGLRCQRMPSASTMHLVSSWSQASSILKPATGSDMGAGIMTSFWQTIPA